MNFDVVLLGSLVHLRRGAFAHRFGGRPEPVHDAVVAVRVRNQFGGRPEHGQMVEHVIDVLMVGRPGVQVPGLQVAADHPYEFAVGKQVPDDAAVLQHGFDAARPHRFEYGRGRYGADRPFGEVHLDVRVAGQPEVRGMVHDEHGFVVGREQLIHEAHVG